MFKNGLFAGSESALDIDDYPPVEIETLHHSTSSDNATIANLVKSAVDQDMEARYATKNKPEVLENKLATQEQPCKHWCQAGQNYVHK